MRPRMDSCNSMPPKGMRLQSIFAEWQQISLFRRQRKANDESQIINTSMLLNTNNVIHAAETEFSGQMLSPESLLPIVRVILWNAANSHGD